MDCSTSYQKTLNALASDATSDVEQVVFKTSENAWLADARIVNKLSKSFAGRYRNEKSIVWNVSARDEVFAEFVKFFTSTVVTISLDNAIELYKLALQFQINVDAIHCITGFIIASFSELNALLIHDTARKHNDYYMLWNTSEYLSTKNSSDKYTVPFKVFSFNRAQNDIVKIAVDERSYIKFSINSPGYLVGVEFAAFDDAHLPFDLEYRFRLSSEEKAYDVLYDFTVKHYHKDANGMIRMIFKEAMYIGADYAYSIELSCGEHNFAFSTGVEQTLFQINRVLDEDGCQFTCISTDSQGYFLTKFSRLFFYPALFKDIEIPQRDEL